MTDLTRQEADTDASAESLGVHFDRRELLALALTHPSASSRKGERDCDNQRLEFLGDRVLGLVVADELLHRFPAEREGHLARRFGALVSAPTLARVTRRIGLEAHLRMGAGEVANDGRANLAAQADACEALIGALYLDGGLERAREFILRQWHDLFDEHDQPPVDAKTALQQWAQACDGTLPRYELVEQTGPDHAPIFTIAVSLPGFAPTLGKGASKREAERAAAASLLAEVEGGPAAAEDG